ncbi:MAG: PilZ domain-containing protein [Candidatus Omnitrophota bacterium]
MENHNERRRFPRFNLLANVEVTKYGLTGKERCSPAKNICQGGVCISVCESPQIDELLDIKINLPGAKEFHVTGKVVWIKESPSKTSSRLEKFDVGLEFVEVGEDVFGEIKRYFYQYQKAQE